jgi:hypothetical protein
LIKIVVAAANRIAGPLPLFYRRTAEMIQEPGVAPFCRRGEDKKRRAVSEK